MATFENFALQEDHVANNCKSDPSNVRGINNTKHVAGTYKCPAFKMTKHKSFLGNPSES